MRKDASASGASPPVATPRVPGGHPPLAGGSYGEPDPADPNVLIGVALPAEAETMRDMAYVFAEEFARMGFGVRRILSLFRSPFYAGAYRIHQALGEQAVSEIVEECVGVWGRGNSARSSDPTREGA